MKLTFSPASPFARKVRIAAIETRADRQDRIRRRDRRAGPGQRRIFAHHAAEEAAGADPRQWRRHPRFLRHRRISRRTRRRRQADPRSGPTRWKVKSDHSLLQGMLDSMLLCRYEKMVRPQGAAMAGVVRRSLEPGLDRHGAVREAAGSAVAARSTSRRSAWSACSAMPISALPIAAGARPIRSSTPSTRRCWSGRR